MSNAKEATIVRTAPRRAVVWPKIKEMTRRNPTVVFGAVVVLAMAGAVLLAPLYTVDPLAIAPLHRLESPNISHWFGTDNLGRDILSRTLNGGRISLMIGLSVAFFATLGGLAIGLISGFFRQFDMVIMRIMDGIMAIPDFMLAILLVAVSGQSVQNIIIAVTITQIPMVSRLVRSEVLTIREQPYVEAGISVGTPTWKILYRHILPNAAAPLLVQATYMCAAAMIVEALLGFIGAGLPPNIPSWGNIMAQGRMYFVIAPWIIFFPGAFLTVTVLAINVFGDGVRDMLDPRLARQLK